MAKCDTCHLYYHLNCLNPPLTRLPKKSKLYGWQCSECDKTSDSEVEQVKTPRRSRYSRDPKFNQQVFTPKVIIKPVEREPQIQNIPNVTLNVRNYPTPNENVTQTFDQNERRLTNQNNGYDGEISHNSIEGQVMNISSRSGKKRRREKHRSRYSPDAVHSTKEHKRKRKKKSLDMENPNPHPRITIKVSLVNIYFNIHFCY